MNDLFYYYLYRCVKDVPDLKQASGQNSDPNSASKDGESDRNIEKRIMHAKNNCGLV